MRYLVWLCFLISVYSSAQSQEDSLKQLLSDSWAHGDIKDTQRHSSQLAWLYFSKNQYDSALKYYHTSLNLIPPDEELRLQGSIMSTLGIIYGAKGKFDSCIFYYRNSLAKLASVKDTANALIAESNLSIVFKNIGLYEESLQAALHVVSEMRPSDNSILRGSCYNTIGSVYIRTRDYDKALHFYRLALENRKINNQLADIARILNNIGELFITTQEYDSALVTLQNAAEIKRQVNDTKGLARTVNNIGRVSMLTGNVKNAEQQFNEAIAILKTVDDPVGMVQVLNNFGELSLNLKQLTQAKKILEEAASIASRAGTPDYLSQNLELQVSLDRERRDFVAGMAHLEQLSTIRDSLLNQEKDRSMQAMQIRYETLKKEQQIAMLEQQEEINRAKIQSSQILIVTLGVGLILVATVGMLAYVNFRNARTARQRIELLLADTRHRTKNNLQTLASIFHLQARYFTDNNMILEAKSSESRVHAMSLLHQKFYSVSEGHTIDLPTYVTDLANQLVDIYGFRTRNLSLAIDIDDFQLDINKALPLSLIIQELVSNAFKYAFENEPSPQLAVRIQVKENGDLQTIVSDNGIGIKINETQTSRGFSLVEDFVTQLDGNLQVKTEKGTTFIISFPLNPLWKRHAS